MTKQKQKTKPIKNIKPKPVSPYCVDTAGLEPRVSFIEGPGLNKTNDSPIVYIEPRAFQKMQQIVDECSLEVGWFCTVNKLANADYLIDEVYLPEQEVTGTETDIPADALEETYLAILAEGKDPSTMYAWFHSHVNMGVSPSGQDETQVETFLQTCPVFIRGIMNKQGHIKVDLYLRDEGIAYNAVPVERYFDPLTAAEENELSKLIKDKVKKQVYQPVNYGFSKSRASALSTMPSVVVDNNYPLDQQEQYEGFSPRSNHYPSSTKWMYGDSFDD